MDEKDVRIETLAYFYPLPNWSRLRPVSKFKGRRKIPNNLTRWPDIMRQARGLPVSLSASSFSTTIHPSPINSIHCRIFNNNSNWNSSKSRPASYLYKFTLSLTDETPQVNKKSLLQSHLNIPDVSTLKRIINYSFKHPELFKEALLTAGASNKRKDIEGPAEGNKLLTLVGDTALQLAILSLWYSKDSSTGMTWLITIRVSLMHCRAGQPPHQQVWMQ